MLILGIDPGTRFCGWGLLQIENKKIVAAGCGVFYLPLKEKLSIRLVELNKNINQLIEEYKPTHAAIEEIFSGKNPKTAFTLGHARGVIMQAIAASGIEVFDYTPLAVKKSVVGNGRASKEQVRYMVKHMVPLKNFPEKDDASDALAVAICHFNKLRFGLCSHT